MTTSGLGVPSWGGVAASLLLVAVAAAVAYRERLRLIRDIVVAAARAGVQLIAVGAILLVLFQRAGLPGAAGWVIVMTRLAERALFDDAHPSPTLLSYGGVGRG